MILMINVLALMENLCSVLANANNSSLTYNIDCLRDFQFTSPCNVFQAVFQALPWRVCRNKSSPVNAQII